MRSQEKSASLLRERIFFVFCSRMIYFCAICIRLPQVSSSTDTADFVDQKFGSFEHPGQLNGVESQPEPLAFVITEVFPL